MFLSSIGKADLTKISVSSKKTKIQSLNLAKPIIEGLLPIGATQEPEDSDEDSPARVRLPLI